MFEMISTLWLSCLIAGARGFGCVLVPLDRFNLIARPYGGGRVLNVPLDQLEGDVLEVEQMLGDQLVGEDEETTDAVALFLEEKYGIDPDGIDPGLN